MVVSNITHNLSLLKKMPTRRWEPEKTTKLQKETKQENLLRGNRQEKVIWKVYRNSKTLWTAKPGNTTYTAWPERKGVRDQQYTRTVMALPRCA